MRTCSGCRGSFVIVGLNCAHLLVMHEDGLPLPFPEIPGLLQSQHRALQIMMDASMRVATDYGSPCRTLH